MQRILILLITLMTVALPAAALAQEQPPLPRPRLDRGDQTQVETNQFDSDGEQGNEALDALASALAERGKSLDTPVPDGPPQPITLSAKISDDGAIIPSGITWRVFDTKPDETGQMALLAKSSESVAVFTLPPGIYVVHAAFGRAQVTNTLRVETQPTSMTLVFNAGALVLNAEISGDIPIPAAQLQFSIYATGDVDQNRVLVADKVHPGETINLNAGVYHIISQYGKLNALMRADLKVEPGQITEATLYHRARNISFKLVSDAGGEAIADVDWTLKTAEGDAITTNSGIFPSMVLGEGDYTIFAKRGSNVYNRNFQVTAGSPEEIEVLTSVY